MVDRQWLGDLSLAVLLALPLAVLASQTSAHRATASSSPHSLASADRLPGDGRIGLLG